MATKKDLIDAQSYSRRRLLAAFTSGAPGGKEVEPSSPLKAVIGGVVLAGMVLVAGVFWGFANPGLKDGWQTNTLVLVRDTGARYVSVEGTLHPVVNATSARLLIPAEEFRVVSTDAASIADAPVGPGVGIVGAPDDVPEADALVASGWTACVSPLGTALSIPGDDGAQIADGGAVVTSDGATYVVAGGYRYLVSSENEDALLRSVGLAEAHVVEVDSRWINLFEEGAPFAPLMVEQAGDPLAGSELVVGTVVHPQGSAGRFLVTEAGELATMGPLAYQLYLLGTGDHLGGEREVTPGEIAQLPTASAGAGGADWPTDLLEPIPQTQAPCALLTHGDTGPGLTELAAAPEPERAGVQVATRSGALVATGGRGEQASRELVLVDESGSAYPMPGVDAATLSRLGYNGDEDVSDVPGVWMQYFTSGPALTIEAAGSTPAGQAVEFATPGPEPSPTSTLTVDSADFTCEPGEVQFTEMTPPALGVLQSEAVWERATGKGIVVAVVDSGIDADNPHLAGVVTGGVDLVGDDESEDGLVDINGHGTAIAGLIASQPVEGSGVVGLAPDVELLSVRIFRAYDEDTIEAGFGPSSQRLAEGIEWAANNGADVINVSLSDNEDTPQVRAAVEKAQAQGALIVASAGNRGTATVKDDGLRYPAAYDGVLAVSAADPTGIVTRDSIHGPHVDIAAPGQNILTATTGGGDCMYSQQEPSSSYATGYVAAAAALVRQAHPGETIEQTSYRLLASAARADADRRDDRAGWGLVQPFDAVTMVPGSGQRGPVNPFTGAEPAQVVPGEVQLVATHREQPFVETQAFMLSVGVVGALALAGLSVGVAFRKRSIEPEEPEERREGLLDRTRAAATQELH